MNNNTINFLIKLKNRSLQNSSSIILNTSSLTFSITKTLYKKGYIQGYTKVSKKQVKIFFRYFYNFSPLSYLKILSKSSISIFVKFNQLSRIKVSKKLFFIATLYGVLDNIDCKKKKIEGIFFFFC